MLTIIVIVAIWSLLSLPLSVVLGFSLRDRTRELVGMDGDDVVYRMADGELVREPLVESTSV